MNDKGLKTHLSIRINRKEPMSLDGFHRWGHSDRNRLHRYVYVTKLTFSHKHKNPLPIKFLASNEALGNFLCQYFDDGDTLYVLGYSHGKTRSHIKLVKLAKVEIKDANNNKFLVSETERLNRYWFRQGNKIRKHQEDFEKVMQV